MRRLLGSVTAEVLRKSTVPVLVTKPHHSAYFIDRVVVSLDGTEVGAGALAYACELARLANVSLEVLHVAENLGRPEQQSQLARITRELADVPVDFEVVIESGSPQDKLASFADAAPGSILVMGSVGATGYGPNRRGSVASRVIENSNSPTLVVPPTKYLGSVIE
jgi:nucleotide-binding universal stress UspA family protein